MGTFNLELEIVPVASLLERTVKEFKLPASEKQVEFTLEWEPREQEGDDGAQGSIAVDGVPEDLSKMISIADPFRLSQVLRNLISSESPRMQLCLCACSSFDANTDVLFRTRCHQIHSCQR